MTNVHILTIGDELLIGQTLDTNSAWMGSVLNDAGFWVHSRSAVGDTREGIIEGLENALSKADIVLITGGLGPTKDDITKHTLCTYFGGNLVQNEDVLNDVTDFFKRVNRPMLEVNLLQAQVPDNCRVIRNKLGTAPGMWFQKDNKVIVSMPGVPFEMKGMMQDDVIPALLKQFVPGVILHKSFLTIGIGESFLAEHIKDFENALPPFIKLAYLPHLNQVRLRLTATGQDRPMLEAAITKEGNTLRQLINEYYAGEDGDTLETIIARTLTTHNKKLALAESCTGGYIAHCFTKNAGASAYLEGSVVSYSYNAKETILHVPHEILEKEGAVSEACVRAMAEAARSIMSADYSIAVSGIAGPDGGTADKPVGTVWIAISSARETKALRFKFARARMQNIESTAITAMIMLHKMLKEELV